MPAIAIALSERITQQRFPKPLRSILSCTLLSRCVGKFRRLLIATNKRILSFPILYSGVRWEIGWEILTAPQAASVRAATPPPTLDRPGGLARNKPGLKISRSENSLLTFR